MRSRVPDFNKIFTYKTVSRKGSIFERILTGSTLFLLLWVCFSTKSLSAPRDKLAIGVFLQSSFSSSLWSPILSCPSRYLEYQDKLNMLACFQRAPVHQDKIVSKTRMLFDNILQLFQSRSPWPGINSDPTVFVLEPIISIGGVLPE